MAAFFEQLWESIFVAGPTPTLLIATNATFGALQLLLFVLLLATHSIHFIILSTLTGGLWWAINWFAREIRAAQAKEEEAKRIREARRGEKDKGKARNGEGGSGDGVEAMDTGDDTETEVEEKYQAQGEKEKKKQQEKSKSKARAPRPETQSTVFVERPSARDSTPVQTSSGPVGASTTGAATRLAPLVDDALKKRKSMGESTGELSTDSEWEKLSQDSGDR